MMLDRSKLREARRNGNPLAPAGTRPASRLHPGGIRLTLAPADPEVVPC